MTDINRDLGLKDVNASGGGCQCGCGHDGATKTATETASAASPENVTYGVTGMTCGHCASAVTSELSALGGVRAVNVDVVDGGTSTVIVTAERELSDDEVRAALDEAGGYQLV